MIKFSLLSVLCHKNIEINQSVLILIFGCLLAQDQSVGSYIFTFLFAELYCTRCPTGNFIPLQIRFQKNI